MTTRILTGDARDVLKTLPDNSIDCVVTSPPYFGLRDYGHGEQIGLEASPAAYVAEMVQIFREVRRVLKKTGTLWLNLGDSYSGSGKGQTADGAADPKVRKTLGMKLDTPSAASLGMREKNLVGIPWRVAFALQDDGWYLRQDIIWHKLNPMPESVRDRCTKAHEYLFLLSKSARYHYDGNAIAENRIEPDRIQVTGPRPHLNLWATGPMARGENGKNSQFADPDRIWGRLGLRNKRSVWSLVSRPFPGAHFATFPPKLVELCLKAGCPPKVCSQCGAAWRQKIIRSGGSYEARKARGIGGPYNMKPDEYQTCGTSQIVSEEWLPSCQCHAPSTGGTVMDPFGGAGTTSLVADRMGLHSVMIELNPDYAEMARWRLIDEAGMFAEVAAE